MKVKVVVMLNVDWQDEDLGTPKEGDPLEERIEASVKEAVWTALWMGRDNGFDHDMEDLISILLDYVTAEIIR